MLTSGLRLIFLLALMAPFQALKAQDDWREGTHYFTIPGASDETGDHVSVNEIFSYACPHCNDFQPFIVPWHAALSADIDFKRTPAVFNRSWEPYARAYLTLETMGQPEVLHAAIFKALHNERRPLRTIDDLATFAAEHGIDRDRFLSTAKSFTVETRLRQSQQQVARWGITGTPSLVVAGRYRIAAGGALATYNDMLRIADWLIARERKRRGLDAAPAE